MSQEQYHILRLKCDDSSNYRYVTIFTESSHKDEVLLHGSTVCKPEMSIL